VLGARPRRKIVAAFGDQFERQIGTHAVDLRQVLAEQPIQRAAHIEPRSVRLPASPLARQRHRSAVPIPKCAQPLEDGLDPKVANANLFLIDVVKGQRLFEREEVLGPIMSDQRFPDHFGT